MGIDARMFVRTKAKDITETDLKHWSCQLGALFGHEKFFIDREGKYGTPQHALEFIDVFQQDGPDIKPDKGEVFIEVHVWTRYWGPGYERGDFPFIFMVAEWLEANIPNAHVWYGGDSSGVEAIPFDRNKRLEYLGHLVGPKGDDYHENWGKFGSLNDIKAPVCEFCDHEMTRHMWSGALGGQFSCHGCGYKLTTRDGGKTFFVPEKKEEY